jgi:hypothetical protein
MGANTSSRIKERCESTTEFEQDLELFDVGGEEQDKKKKVDGKAKGDRGELILAKLLSKHFGKEFSRGVGSGNRWSQVSNMPEHAKATFLGDICPPENFLWVIECKNGYEDEIDLNNALGPIAKLDEFIEKSLRDSKLSGRDPIICWKRKWKPWVAILPVMCCLDPSHFDYYMQYRDWMIVELEKLLNITEKEYWFDV